MTYFVIGLMSGSSHDGLDICYAHLTLISGKKWEYEIQQAETIAYPTELRDRLKNAAKLSVPDFLRLNTEYGRFCGNQIKGFIEKYDLEHKVFYIASHGHTVWHEPQAGVSTQIGDGATIAAITGYSTISDFRNMDVALGGQGAPIVPIADRYLFPEFDFCLNLGGIANLTINREENPIAFDICPANQLLDFFAHKKGLEFDQNGSLAAAGICNDSILNQINGLPYFSLKAPKSLNNSFSTTEILPSFRGIKEEDALSTCVRHIASQIAQAIRPFADQGKDYQMLITGGGAFNQYLISQIKGATDRLGLIINCVVPDSRLIKYKEALAMALLGTLRWREETNSLSSVTGASRDSVGGAFWFGNN